MMYRSTEVKDVAALPCLLPLALAMSCQLKVSVTPEGRYQADASYWYKVGCWSWKKKFGDSRRAKKTLSFPVQPARILFQIKKKKNLMVSLSYVRKICYFGVLLVQIVLP